MARRGENIHKRKDGRWEGRYIKARTPDRRICWGYVMTDLNRRVGDKPFIVEVGEIESVDIDEAEDFMIADAIYNYQLQQK